MTLSRARLPIGIALIMLNGSLAAQESNDRQNKLLRTFRDEFVVISPGTKTFPETILIGRDEQGNPGKPIRLTKTFSISRYEVYQELYESVMGHNSSRWKGPRNSAEQMTFDEARQFCSQVTDALWEVKLIEPNQIVRLPTEVEWEYCVRAGTSTRYSFGDEPRRANDPENKASLLDEYAWHTGNAAGNDPAVGVLKPNPWGLYDVHGYLWEFCLDDWSEDRSDYGESAHRPLAIKDSKLVAIRGGSWKDHYSLQTSFSRKAFAKTGRDDAVGFRCLLAEEETP